MLHLLPEGTDALEISVGRSKIEFISGHCFHQRNHFTLDDAQQLIYNLRRRGGRCGAAVVSACAWIGGMVHIPATARTAESTARFLIFIEDPLGCETRNA